MPWFDLDEEYFLGHLPEALDRARAEIKRSNNDVTGIEVCREFSQARTVLEFVNSSANRNELIGLESTLLASVKGTQACDHALEWLGYDIVAFGNGSLLREGLFAVPSAFGEWQDQLNGHGLFSGPHGLDGFVDTFRGAIERGLLKEQLPGFGIDTVRVGRLRST